jgi:hypothetical protein
LRIAQALPKVVRTLQPSRLDGWGDSREAKREPHRCGPKSDVELLGRLLRRAGKKMTAEVAVLNKSAVALAADSAVTISVGDEEKKTYDTADKLFELCRHNPIGIMVYNGLSFVEIPLQTIIKQFRSDCDEFNSVKDAADCFLGCLNKIGVESPQRVKDDSVKQIYSPVIEAVRVRFFSKFQDIVFKTEKPPADLPKIMAGLVEEAISFYEKIYSKQKTAKFVGVAGIPDLPDHVLDIIRESVDNEFQGPMFNDANKARIIEIAKLSLTAEVLSENCTGIVIAGFGAKELFPTLISFELDGMVGDHLKYVQPHFVDIDRLGTRARVLPFAQKEMMDRFMYGMDDSIERSITDFCAQTVPTIREAVISRVNFDSDDDKTKFENGLSEAEESCVCWGFKKPVAANSKA